jgi:DNA-binding NarL/FixJ family response regulator
MAIRVVIIEDVPLRLEGLKSLCATERDLALVATAAERESACKIIEEQQPDVVLIAEGLARDDAFALTRDLAHRGRRVLMLASHRGPLSIAEAFAAGATGYVCSSETLDEILSAIRDVANGRKRVPASALRDEPPPPFAMSVCLTPREREVFSLLVHGLDNGSIAKTLFISVKTVETHRSRIFKKFGVHSLLELVRLAHRASLTARPIKSSSSSEAS